MCSNRSKNTHPDECNLDFQALLYPPFIDKCINIDAQPSGRCTDRCIVMDGFPIKTLDDSNNGREMCPVLVDPDPDCYCFGLSSIKILCAIKYCLQDFRECEIYQRVFHDGRA